MGMYKQDPNNTSKQIPIARTGRPFYSHATCPSAQTIAKRPTQVIINRSGSYGFLYESTCSIGATHSATGYVTGSVVQNDNVGAITLDINPIAWVKNSPGVDPGGDVGDVTFVYKRLS